MDVSYESLLQDKEKLQSEKAILKDRITQKMKALGIASVGELPNKIKEAEELLSKNTKS